LVLSREAESYAKKGRTMTNSGSSDHLLTIRGVAECLHVSPTTIYRMTREQTIPGAFRIRGSGRFDAEQLDFWTKTVEHPSALGMKKTDRK
jgi:excisionase family DNA binding protein